MSGRDDVRTMRAATFTDYGEPLEVQDVDGPSPDPDGVVVEIDACGVCRSDWHAWRGDWGEQFEPGHVFGHEPAGHVVAVGDEVQAVSEGDHVTVPFHLCDGTCQRCRNGHSNLCENGVNLGLEHGSMGAFAEQLSVPDADHNVVTLPDGVSSIDMAGLGCRFMTAFHALNHQADVGGGDWVAVHGCGGVGLSAVHIADALGANVIAVDLDDDKLEKAEELGAAETINAGEAENVSGTVHAISDGGAHVSLDALGIAETCTNSVMGLRPRGQHVQIGLTTAEEGGSIPLPTDLMVIQEIEFLGSFGMPAPRYDEIFRMIEDGSIDPSAVVSGTIGIEDVSDTLFAMSDFETDGIPVVDHF